MTTPRVTVRKKLGRPTLYNLALAERICEQVAIGIPVHTLATYDWAPAESQITAWLNKYPEFQSMYARARDRLADRFAAEVVTISDGANADTIRGIELARTRMDARKWAAAKLAPRKYSERLKSELSGPEGAPIEIADASSKLLDLLNRQKAG